MEYKGFNIDSDGTFGYLEISRKGSGRLPPSLGGRYTTLGIAKRKVDSYVNNKETKKNGEAEGTAGI